MGTGLICLDENSALDFLSGRLGPMALSETERHLGACGSCLELLARSAPFLSAKNGEGAARAARHNVSPIVSTLAMRPLRAAVEAEAEANAAAELDAALSDISDPGANGDATGDPADSDEAGPPPTLAPGTVLKDTYKVVSLIGRGGMGEVYEVIHTRLAGRYALKLLPPAFAHEHVSVTRFRREADITSALRHPHIVQVIDFDHTPAGQPFLVMEFLDGGDLSQLMAARGPMPLDRVLKIVAQIVSALSAVHRKGIVHRDLKPQNVLLVHDDDPAVDRVKLVDFGLSKRSETSLLGLSANISRERTLLGTPRYMAPEQASGRIDEIDAKTDQFALGAMVYEMLTGLSAFNGEHIALLLYRIVSEEPVPMRSLVPELPEHVEWAVRQAMSKQRSERFATVNEFFEALSGTVGAPAMVPTHALTASQSGEREGMVATAARPAAGPPTISTEIVAAAPVDGEAPARARRRRIGSFALGLAAAIAGTVAVRTLRSPSPSAAVTTSGESRPPAAARTPAPPPEPAAAPASVPEPPPPPSVTAATAGGALEAARAAAGAPLARVHRTATTRRANTSKHRPEAPEPVPPASPSATEKSHPASPQAPVGRLIEEL